jgi:hypothetical protein
MMELLNIKEDIIYNYSYPHVIIHLMYNPI